MEAIRQQLQEALEAARSRLGSIEGTSLRDSAWEMTAAAASPGDEMDQAQANESREQVLSARQRLVEYVRRLVVALDRLRDGGYGVCLECGEPIGVARLRVLPEAETCVTCQDRIERLDAHRAIAGELAAVR